MKDGFLKMAIDHFGENVQMIVCIEEMAELTQQLSKFIIGHKNKNRKKLVEEHVDVLIMLDQMKIIFDIGDDEINELKDFKFNRLEKYIEEQKEDRAKWDGNW